MSIALRQCCSMGGVPFLYVDIGTNTITYFKPSEKHAQPPMPVEWTPRLETFFRLSGYMIKTVEEPIGVLPAGESRKKWFQFTEEILRAPAEYASAIHCLNRITYRMTEDRMHPLIEASGDDVAELRKMPRGEALLLLLEKCGLTRSKDGLHFVSFLAVEFSNGRWLELHTYRLVKKILKEEGGQKNPKVEINCEVTDPKKIENGKIFKRELDVLAYYNNTLYAFECKTCAFPQRPKKGGRNDNWESYDEGRDKAKETISKLELLARAACGLRRKSIIVSLDDFVDMAKLDAVHYKVDLITGNGLALLEQKLRKLLLGKDAPETSEMPLLQEEAPDEALADPETEEIPESLPAEAPSSVVSEAATPTPDEGTSSGEDVPPGAEEKATGLLARLQALFLRLFGRNEG